jgi:hypothetical protein
MEDYKFEPIMIGIHERMYDNLLVSTIIPEIYSSKLPIFIPSPPEKVKHNIPKIRLSDILYYPKISIKELTLPYHKTNEFKDFFLT